jgi:hypothetical protein
MITFLYGAAQVAVGVASAWLLVTFFFEMSAWLNDQLQAIRCRIWKRKNPPEDEHVPPS